MSQDRPCKRCIKRNIGHLCHDEPREGHGYHKKSKADSDATGADADETSPNKDEYATGTPNLGPHALVDEAGHSLMQDDNMTMRQPADAPMPSSNPSAPAQAGGSVNTGNSQPRGSSLMIVNDRSELTLTDFGYNDPWLGVQNRFHDMHAFHPQFMFNANEVTDEFNLLNDFLSTSLFEETGMHSTDEFGGHYDPSFMSSMAEAVFPPSGSEQVPGQQQPPPPPNFTNNQHIAAQGALISRPSSVKPVSDKAREKYYMMAADPSGTESPEERMNKLLKAKYDAGMLRPFNYVNGYARLNKYMEKNMKHSSRHKILMQLDQFRPKFRERMQSLTDIELVLVEMWFERSLMEYDRIFASMAIPACCWRRTGEIFRGNKEMAELIHAPIESLRDVS